MPATLVSSRSSAPAASPVKTKQSSTVRRRRRANGTRLCAKEQKEGGEWQPIAIVGCDRLDLTVGSVENCDLAAIADGDAVPLEIADLVGHRLAESAGRWRSALCWCTTPNRETSLNAGRALNRQVEWLDF
jgi:hypothetical protein